MPGASDIHLRSRRRGAHEAATLVSVNPARAGWEFISFAVRALKRGASWMTTTGANECCFVLLSGECSIQWRTRDGADGEATLGPRASVFVDYPHALYLPRGTRAVITATRATQLADCRAPSRIDLSPYVIRPQQCGFEIRGGGNATRQIIDVLMPNRGDADRLMICEVFTPGGNWSSYPPHKHDRDRPPHEADLEEIYYFRFRDADGYGIHRVYTADARRDEAVVVGDGDVVLVREGYHPFVAAHGYDAYYLNVLAGGRRSMAAVDDPRFAKFRHSWPPPDPRLPMIPPPAGNGR